jgi:hypothetical protein
VLKEWDELNNKPMKVMHDGGKEFTANKFNMFFTVAYYHLDIIARLAKFLITTSVDIIAEWSCNIWREV